MKRSTIDISGHHIGPGQRPFIVAEVAQAHDGSLGTAHAFIDLAAECGADAIKFQTHIADAESTLDEPFRVKFSRQDETRLEYWQRTSFTEEQWRGLLEHAREQNLVFLSSAFSRAAMEMLGRLGMPAWKIGSGETVTGDLIDAAIETGQPVLVSTGMSSWAEIDAIIGRLGRAGVPHALFQCTSRYPASLAQVGLNAMFEMQSRYDCPVGLSDHTGSLWPPVAALTLGAHIIEVHLAMHPRAFGPDVAASLMPDDLRRLCEARDAIVAMQTSPVDKDAIAAELAPMRALFSKSIAPVRTLPAGHVLTVADLTLKKPGTGLPAQDLKSLVGRKLVRAVSQDRLLTAEDIG